MKIESYIIFTIIARDPRIGVWIEADSGCGFPLVFHFNKYYIIASISRVAK